MSSISGVQCNVMAGRYFKFAIPSTRDMNDKVNIKLVSQETTQARVVIPCLQKNDTYTVFPNSFIEMKLDHPIRPDFESAGGTGLHNKLIYIESDKHIQVVVANVGHEGAGT